MNELSKDLRCILLFSGIEIWLEYERAERLLELLKTLKEVKFVEINGSLINTSSIQGVFPAREVEDMRRRKTGLWKCRRETWHLKGQLCDCTAPVESFEAPPDDRTAEERENDERALAKLRDMMKNIGSG